jgi:hypothetical protein
MRFCTRECFEKHVDGDQLGAPPERVQRYLDNMTAGEGRLLLLLQTKDYLRQDEEVECKKMEEFLKKRCEA